MKLILWLWNSPTFTTWGKLATQSIRLIAVTPLILTHFGETEIAAWYLFASLNLFGNIINQRIGLTFSRMISFAMGGAENLSPVKSASAKNTSDQCAPNWDSLERAYATVSTLQLAVTLVSTALAIAMGWFALTPMLQGYEAAADVWIAFSVIQATFCIAKIFGRYSIALWGMNYVALSNRWDTLINIASMLAGLLTIALGGGIASVAVAMQSLILAGVLRNYLLIFSVEDGRVARFRQYGFNRDIFLAAWPPLWKGFIGQFSNSGVIQLSGVIFARYGDLATVATYLFSLRIMQMLVHFTDAPLSSQQPKMSRMLASGDQEKLAALFYKRMPMALGLLALGVITLGVVGDPLLRVIGANISFMNRDLWFVFGGLILVQKALQLHCMFCACGNHVIYYWRIAISGLFSLVLLLLTIRSFGVLGIVLSMTVPYIMILNYGPLRETGKLLGTHAKYCRS